MPDLQLRHPQTYFTRHSLLRDLLLYPHIILSRPFALHTASVDHAARLDQQQFDLVPREGFLFDALWNDEYLAARTMERIIAKVDPQVTFDRDERLGKLLIVEGDRRVRRGAAALPPGRALALLTLGEVARRIKDALFDAAGDVKRIVW